MSKTMMSIIGVALLLAAIVVGCFASYISANNYGARVEAQLRAEYSNNQNILASYTQKVKEAAQVPGMMTEDLSKVTREAIQGRYGPDGSKAVFQWLKEQNPQLDSKLYVKLQQIIESGRDEFKIGQTRMLDVKRQYETNLGLFWTGTWMRLAGFPKEDLNKYVPVIVDSVEVAFKTGKEASPIQLR